MLSTLLLIALSKPSHPHQKKTCNTINISNKVITITSHILHLCISYPFLVEVRGFAPLSRTPFSLLHTAILTLYSIFSYKANLFLYSNRNFLKPAIQLSLFSINNRGKSLSTPIIIIRLPTGIPVRSSNATAYAAVCIK